MRRAFSLIEITVALAISGVLLTVVMSTLTVTLRDSRRTRVHSEILREAESVSHLLNSELRLAGLGVPTGVHTDATYGTTPPVSFYAALIVGGSNQIGVLADLPRPDANYSAFGAIHSRPTGLIVQSVAWHTENNGACMPDSTGTSCVAGRDSLFFADNAAGCNATGTGAPFEDRKCPWGLRRVLAGESIVIAAGDGNWSDATITGEVVRNNLISNAFAARVNPGYDFVDWPNLLPGQGPGGIAGQGFVATPDRVFYSLVGATIVRRQCWGDPNPNDGDWPNAATNTVPASPETTSGGGAANTTCTPAEVVARNVTSLAFSYFDALGAAVTVSAGTKAAVRRVDYIINFAKTVDGRPVLHQVTGSVRLTNLP